jgi:tRNA(fMet)-specific endonuclease VapC
VRLVKNVAPDGNVGHHRYTLGTVGRHPALAHEQALVDEVLALIPVEEYAVDVARVHARLLAQVRRLGKTRGAYDLLIAVTAAATARIVIAMDSSAAFDDLHGVRAQIVPR